MDLKAMLTVLKAEIDPLDEMIRQEELPDRPDQPDFQWPEEFNVMTYVDLVMKNTNLSVEIIGDALLELAGGDAKEACLSLFRHFTDWEK